MRKLYLLVTLIICFAVASHAQQCQTDSGLLVTDTIMVGTDSVAIFTPSSDSLPCIVRAQPVIDTLYFSLFNSIQGFTLDSLTIDSIGNLPAGLCWSSNSLTNTFYPGQNGAIVIQGQTYVSSGQYKMQVFVSGATDAFPIPFSSLESLAGIRYYLKVICPGDVCQHADTAGGRDSLFIPYSSVCGVGINEINNGVSHLSVTPNPFSGSAMVSFSSDVQGSFICRITDLLGAVFSSQTVSVTQGQNVFTVDRKGLSPGMYILSISDGQGAISRKIVLE